MERYSLRVSPLLLGAVRQALIEEGFRDTRFQFRRENQAFGLVKRLSFRRQMHVRAFLDGTLKAEEEIWRFLVPFHFLRSPKIKVAHQKLKSILEKHSLKRAL